MKATGIVRKIDEMGRIVIPKEMRNHLNIAVGDPIEFFTDDEQHIIMRKYKINDDLTESVCGLKNLLDSYGGQLPFEILTDMRQHVSEMQKLLDQK